MPGAGGRITGHTEAPGATITRSTPQNAASPLGNGPMMVGCPAPGPGSVIVSARSWRWGAAAGDRRENGTSFTPRPACFCKSASGPLTMR